MLGILAHFLCERGLGVRSAANTNTANGFSIRYYERTASRLCGGATGEGVAIAVVSQVAHYLCDGALSRAWL